MTVLKDSRDENTEEEYNPDLETRETEAEEEAAGPSGTSRGNLSPATQEVMTAFERVLASIEEFMDAEAATRAILSPEEDKQAKEDVNAELAQRTRQSRNPHLIKTTKDALNNLSANRIVNPMDATNTATQAQYFRHLKVIDEIIFVV